VNVAALLSPYVEDLTPSQLDLVSKYVDILLRWNARMNLTAIRDPEQIVVRHFGESFYLARRLAEAGALPMATKDGAASRVVDVGSGAGFPGIPLKIARPGITLTLVEAQQRKAVFLKEVLRSLNLDAEVKNIRAEELARTGSVSADVVTLRAVEKFESILPVSASFVGRDGQLAILIGTSQAGQAQKLLENWTFAPLFPVPGSNSRVILLANQGGK
jgi:16S rRNA (guanine527-N7)-methyltransferase